jgi:lipopolysaccharide export system ATP-binding protein
VKLFGSLRGTPKPARKPSGANQNRRPGERKGRQEAREPMFEASETYDDRSPDAFDDEQPYDLTQSASGHSSVLPEAYAGEGWLTARGIKKAYGRRQVVKGVSLAVRRGEAVGLLGPNGAGKTTVFYMITGLVPADDGKILIDGNDATTLPMYRRARLGIGYLPQEASIFRGLTVEQNIMAVLELVEPNRRKRQEQLDSLLEEFRITRLRKSPSIALSGGERRRCEIARALASRPSFILLDEPFAGIDPIAVGDIQVLVQHLTQRGIGVLITDHNVRETLNLIDRAYIIYDGQVLTQGTPEQVIANPDVRRVYLGDMKL